ncbi:MAG: AAA family ATPase [Methylococcaceae bacterium]
MKIDFERFGCIDKGSVELNDFTIFCGKNNSGKTYVMYALYGLLANRFTISFDFVKPIVEQLKQKGNIELDIAEIIEEHQEEMLNDIKQRLKEYLPNLFGVVDNEFNDSKIKLSFTDNEIKERIKRNVDFGHSWGELKIVNTISLKTYNKKIKLTLKDTETKNDDLLQVFISEKLIDILFFDWSFFPHCFLLPAERNGINTFSKELFSIRNLLLQQAQNNNVNPMILLKDIFSARYAEPIKDYLQFINNIGTIQQDNSSYSNYAQTIQTNVLGGDYLVDELGSISFTTHQNNKNIPLHFSSSTVKSLFGLVFYLKHIARYGDYLMIDEPELNLHPDNQREVARILAQLVNAGLKVIVSTHSDYFVRELNNLIMLKNDFSGVDALKQKYHYQDNELLDSSKVSAYLFDNNTIEKMPLGEEGIVADTFNQVIHELNQSSNEIYYAMQDAKELENW